MRPLSLTVSDVTINILPKGDVRTRDRRMYYLLRGYFGPSIHDRVFKKSDLDLEIRSIRKESIYGKDASKTPVGAKSLQFSLGEAVLSMNHNRKKASLGVVSPEYGGTGFFVTIYHALLYAASLLGSKYSYLLLHAAGIAINKKGCLFFGRSGAGKTTLCTLLRDHDVFSDDVSLIKKTDRGYFLKKTPFRQFSSGTKGHSNTKKAPVTALFILKKSDTCAVESLSMKETLPALIKEGIFFYEKMSTGQRAHVFNFCFTMLCSIPAYRLYFKNTKTLKFFLEKEVPA